MHRIVLIGNSGSGKSTMARALANEFQIEHLDLDSLAWARPGIRAPIDQSAVALRAFMAARRDWVIEGCYADLLAVALEQATEIRFLNPGVKTCIANCRARPWEPDKYRSKAAQDEKLEFLLGWVREYETRDDEYSLKSHRQLFDSFAGRKSEILANTNSSR